MSTRNSKETIDTNEQKYWITKRICSNGIENVLKSVLVLFNITSIKNWPFNYFLIPSSAQKNNYTKKKLMRDVSNYQEYLKTHSPINTFLQNII